MDEAKAAQMKEIRELFTGLKAADARIAEVFADGKITLSDSSVLIDLFKERQVYVDAYKGLDKVKIAELAKDVECIKELAAMSIDLVFDIIENH